MSGAGEGAPPSFDASVRLPSHISPPFRARQWWQDNRNSVLIAAPNVRRWATRWNKAPVVATGSPVQYMRGDPVPTGMRGVVSHLHYWLVDISVTTFFPLGQFELFIAKNGQNLDGYSRMTAGFEASSFTAANGISRVWKWPGPKVVAPIHLDEGDFLDLVISSEGVGAFYHFLQWAGWLYPKEIEGDAGSIRETQVDRGALRPLARPY